MVQASMVILVFILTLKVVELEFKRGKSMAQRSPSRSTNSQMGKLQQLRAKPN